MPAQSQPQGGEADNSLAALWITIGVFALGFFIWYFFKIYIISALIFFRGFEVEFISFFVPHEWSQTLQQASAFVSTSKANHYSNVNFNDLVTLSNQVGDYLRWPTAIILIGLSVLVYITNPTANYKRTYNMKTLLKEEKKIWPHIVPVANLDLIHEDLDKGPWAMSVQPMAFAKKNNLLVIEKVLPSGAVLQSKAITVASINRDEARKLLALQVGKYWSGVEALPVHARALFAAFAARIAGDREGPSKLLNQIGASVDSGQLDFSGVDDLLQKQKNSKAVTRITRRHAFVLTVMASMLEQARQDGVMATAEFLWLKPIDRRLWYLLNSVGRQTPFVEVAGPFAHWLAEKELGRKINVPIIEEAVNGLEAAVKEFILKPDEDEEELILT